MVVSSRLPSAFGLQWYSNWDTMAAGRRQGNILSQYNLNTNKDGRFGKQVLTSFRREIYEISEQLLFSLTSLLNSKELTSHKILLLNSPPLQSHSQAAPVNQQYPNLVYVPDTFRLLPSPFSSISYIVEVPTPRFCFS